jgi:hypothetical protein
VNLPAPTTGRTEVVDVLSPADETRLTALEAAIEDGRHQVWQALREIHDSGLYRGEHPTFKDYCAKRWGISERRGRQLVEAAEIGTMVPVENERQARELVPLRGKPERILNAWNEAQERAQREERKLTASDVRAAVRLRMPNGNAPRRSETSEPPAIAPPDPPRLSAPTSPKPAPAPLPAQNGSGPLFNERGRAALSRFVEIEPEIAVDEDDLEEWRRLYRQAWAALDRLGRRIAAASGEGLTEDEEATARDIATSAGIDGRLLHLRCSAPAPRRHSSTSPPTPTKGDAP